MTELCNAPVLAIDLGGTKILAALIAADGTILFSDVSPTKASLGVDAVIERLCNAVDRVLAEAGIPAARLPGISIAAAGGIDTASGVIVTPSPNIPSMENVPLKDIVERRYGVPVKVLNDASAAALGEHRFGAGRGTRHLVLLTLGTGIGGGVIINGKLYLGAVGAAAEIGHMSIVADGPQCGCGHTGCLEVLASGTAVARDAVNSLRNGAASVLPSLAGGDIEKITAKMVGKAAMQGDLLARQVLERAARYLGIGLVNLVNIFNPDIIVLGGGMAALGDILIEPGRTMVAERALPVSARVVRIETAALGNDAGVYGAAAYIRDCLEDGAGQ